jgi:hypothetical protein
MARPLRAHWRASNFAPGEIVVDDNLSVVFDQRVHLAPARQRLHHGYVDPAGRLGLATADCADHPLADAKKGLQAFLPLLEEFGAMHQDQSIHTLPRDHRSGRHRFAECGRRAEHAGIVLQHRRDSRLLVNAQGADEGHVQRCTGETLVFQIAGDAVVAEQ